MERDSARIARRRALQLSGCAGALLVAGRSPDAEAQPAPAAPAEDLPAAIRALQPATEGVSPIAVDEHRGRLARAQRLLAEAGLDAMVIGPGSSLAYFTGAEWGLSERFLGIVLGRSGDPVWITPAFEKDRALEKVRVGTDVRAWAEDESPYLLVAQALAERGAAGGRVGLIDAAARKVIEDGGFGPGYRYFTHRLGHGIGLDGHEWPYMVRGGRTTLAAGMNLHRRAGNLHSRRDGYPP
jgi:Xaa-Pro dipeptidase